MLKIAAICAVYNEEALLPQFLAHYSPQVDTVFLLDNESTDKSLEIARQYPNVAVSRYSSNGQFSDVALSEAYNKKRRECAGQYDYVIIVDCDEFVVPKHAPNLRDAIMKAQPSGPGLGVEFFWTQGWNMWAAPGASPYDPKRSLLLQRATGIPSQMYSKPCIIRPGSTLRYEHGRHDFVGLRDEKPADMNPMHFHLLHYIGFDLDEYVRRGLERTNRFAKVNILMGTSGQYLRKTEEDYRKNFLEHQASSDLVKVPFTYDGARPSGRRLTVGSRHAPRAGWDSLDVDMPSPPTYQFDLMAPNWPIEDDVYDELAIANVFEYLSAQEAALLLRRFWRIMKVGGTLRLSVPSLGQILSSGRSSTSALVDALQELLYESRSAVSSSQIRKTLYDFETLRAILFKSGFMDVEDISTSYEDEMDIRCAALGFPVSLKVRAFKQAPGGTFGWNHR